MKTSGSPSVYVLGNTDREHERLAHQAKRFDPLTERLFRAAGIGEGQRVLDLGSGAGHVAMILARLVGPSGEVVGIERNARTIEHAKKRLQAAGIKNVTFTQADVGQLASEGLFDAAAGRFILMFLPDPVDVVRRLSNVVRPGGVISFYEPTWKPFLAATAHLPLWSQGTALIHETFKRSGADPEMGAALHRVFREAGLPAPAVHMDMLLGDDPDFTRWVADILRTMEPQIREHNLSLEPLGDFETLAERLHAEVQASNGVTAWPAGVGAWSTKRETSPRGSYG